ncbi:bacteriophage antitermination protein Q [Pseudenterobacter timonensis]|uniref:Bacteriophage antitermination protein Q n=1 Tax=Pseudenterobacter timonensis TaxID=1755099 RepID=A0AAE4DM06_9ENTR|nr:bacteriophage antitermination protein Q [Pseudenterobacter timonensis]MDR9889859.1 bacteriophage antitermination protein Q [Pseudenterobacter timonensis]
MNVQYLQYVREQLIVATADLSGATKGQLVAFAENAMFTATPRSRSRVKVINPANGKLVNPSNPPIPGQQSRAKGSHIPLVQPVEYSTASWRRAVLSLEEHQKAWLLWNYSGKVSWDHQVAITKWVWATFQTRIVGKRVAKKTISRIRDFVWLSVQDVRSELAGEGAVEHQKLAELTGVSKSTWSETYLPHWEVLREICMRLDKTALLTVSRSRSQQKAANYVISLAKPN